MISKKCKVCRKPNRPFKTTCSIECEAELGLKLLEKAKRAEAKQVRAVDKVRKEKLKSRSDWMREAQQAFNAFIRKRDQLAGHRCISSGKVLDWSGNATDCGHFRSVGSAPQCRFNENNAHAQSKHDNRYLSGNAIEYRKGLIERIGLQAVEELEANNTVQKWSIDDLKQIKEKYRQKFRDLKTTVN